MRKLIIGRRTLILLSLLAGTTALSTRAPGQNQAGVPIALGPDRLELVNRTATAASGEVLMNAGPDAGLAWIAGLTFNEGCLTLEVQGSNDFGRSFVGIAFRGVDQNSYDVVYVRPFVFRSDNPAYVANGLQYMSMPDYPWPVLRAQSPGIYEVSIGSTPPPEDWVQLVVRFGGGRLKAFVNGAVQPQLDVPLLTRTGAGRVALWVGNNSSGAFRNLRNCS
jgi:hypothetical protein